MSEGKMSVVRNFVQLLKEDGDVFFSTGSTEQDFEKINRVVKQQGYWSGARFRYYFDDKFNLTKKEERMFG